MWDVAKSRVEKDLEQWQPIIEWIDGKRKGVRHGQKRGWGPPAPACRASRCQTAQVQFCVGT